MPHTRGYRDMKYITAVDKLYQCCGIADIKGHAFHIDGPNHGLVPAWTFHVNLSFKRSLMSF